MKNRLDNIDKLLMFALLYFLFMGFAMTVNAQIKHYDGELYHVVYSEDYEQPLQVTYTVMCPTGEISRSGMDFWKPKGWKTSDNDDYKANVYDKGHMAPAAAFNCFDKETLRETFNYLNCALQHESLNRGPWKELERFERDLSKVFETVKVNVTVHFDNEPEYVAGGALIPSGFTKQIWAGEHEWTFYFDNINLKGRDWSDFQIPNIRQIND